MDLIRQVDIVDAFDKDELIRVILLFGKEEYLQWIFKTFEHKEDIVKRLRNLELRRTTRRV